MNIWLSSLKIRAHLSWRTGKHLHVLHVLRTYSTCSCPGQQDTTTYAALGWDKRKKQKMPVCLCLCTFIEIRRGTKNLDLVLCTVVYIGLGKTSVTIWTIGSLENWGNHWGKWTILRSFRTTWVTLHDCIGGVTWQHIVPGRFLQIDYTQFDRLNLCC